MIPDAILHAPALGALRPPTEVWDERRAIVRWLIADHVTRSRASTLILDRLAGELTYLDLPGADPAGVADRLRLLADQLDGGGPRARRSQWRPTGEPGDRGYEEELAAFLAERSNQLQADELEPPTPTAAAA